MSGGSFDYLCFNTDDLSGRRRMVEEMARRLEKLPYASEAAADTRRIIALLDETQALGEQLADVWQAVEWWASGDSGEEQAQEALTAYRDTAAADRLSP